jgi:hypothetical protein
MYRQHGGEPRAVELPYDIEDTRIVGSLANGATQIGGMKLAVIAWRGLDLVQQFLLSWVDRFFDRWRRYLAWHFTGRRAPSAHEAEQEASWDRFVASRSVESQEAIPNHLRIDVPTRQGGLRRLNQVRPTGLENVRNFVNGYLS